MIESCCGKWIENGNGNWVLIDMGEVVATVYARSGGWGAVWNGAGDCKPRWLKGTFDYPEHACDAVETAISEGPHSLKWWPPDEDWVPSKKGGYYRRVDGSIVSVKESRSKSWYAVHMGGALLGKAGRPSWFSTAEQARDAVNACARGDVGWEWIERG
jgi:hypothetical protein